VTEVTAFCERKCEHLRAQVEEASLASPYAVPNADSFAGETPTLPEGVRRRCARSFVLRKSNLIHKFLPLWIAAGAFLINTLALLAWNGSPAAKTLITVLAGTVITAGLTLYWYLTLRHEAARRAETVALVNHHVRNALQTLYLLDLPTHQEALVQETSNRIDWALREVLGPSVNEEQTSHQEDRR
jgi:hypothetical protein